MRLLLTLALAILTGCSMIPYDTPEARANIQRDLNVQPQEIIGITETNWCTYNYGDSARCRAVQGLGVLTTKGLVLSVYENKTYYRVFTLKAENTRCTHTITSKNTAEIFYAFTDNQAFMLAPITPGGQMNLPMKVKIYDYLSSQGAKKLIGSNVVLIKDTGEIAYSDSIILTVATPSPFPSSSPIYIMINPCDA